MSEMNNNTPNKRKLSQSRYLNPFNIFVSQKKIKIYALILIIYHYYQVLIFLDFLDIF